MTPSTIRPTRSRHPRTIQTVLSKPALVGLFEMFLDHIADTDQELTEICLRRRRDMKNQEKWLTIEQIEAAIDQDLLYTALGSSMGDISVRHDGFRPKMCCAALVKRKVDHGICHQVHCVSQCGFGKVAVTNRGHGL